VQLAAVPVPTTVVGFDVSTGCPSAGTPVEHDPFGLPFGIEPLLEPPDPLLELAPVVEVVVVPVVVDWPLPPVPLELPGPPLVPTPAPVVLWALEVPPPLLVPAPVLVEPFVDVSPPFEPQAAAAMRTNARPVTVLFVPTAMMGLGWRGMSSSVDPGDLPWR
jgi:hypothetical protein